MIWDDRYGDLTASSVQSGSPITLIQGGNVIVVEADVLLQIVNKHWPIEDREDA